jgi:TonB-linked SusC/RagA family outer membrane protein
MKFTSTKIQKPKWLLFFLFALLMQHAVAQQGSIAVSGIVTDEKGETMPGVNVRLKNSTIGTTTDVNGKYVLNLSDAKGTLVATFIGYKPTEVALDGKTTFNITLTAEARSLNEVVVIGYGTQKRETVTGAISTVKAEDFNAGNITDPLTLIAGKVAGLSVSKAGGSDPNAGADFSLRGPATVEGNNQPLIIIDGVPGGDINTIAPADIASIDILKDGSAAAIYGSRATAGVIIITTKKGKAGVTTVTYNGTLSTDVIAKKYDVLNAAQYIKLGEDNGFDVDDRGANTNWFNEITRQPVSHQHNLSLSGGTDKTTYYAAVNYRNLEGMDIGTNREFINGTVRINTKAMNDKLDFGIMLTNSYDEKSYANTGAISQSLNMNPTYPVRNPDGTFFENPDIPYQLQWNPVANIYNNTFTSKEKRFLGTINATYHILPSLKATLNYSITRNQYLNNSYSSNEDFFQVQNGTGGQASRSLASDDNNLLEGLLTYTKQFNKHSFDVIGGYSYQNFFSDSFGAGNNSFNTNAFLYYNLGAGSGLNNLNPGANRNGVYVSSYASQRTILAYFGRVLYNYDEKYLLNLSLRREGSTVLGADNKWGNFVGASAGWILTRESFLDDSHLFKNLKLRGGYGVTGNQESLGPYQSLSALGPFGSDAGPQNGYFGEPGNGTWILPYGPTINANPLLRWETKKEVNVGLDFTLFESGWLSGSLDYYNRRINNLVGNYTAQLPSQVFPTIYANAGLMVNEGYELALSAKLINTKKFSWNATLTGAYNRNEIVSITSDQFKGAAQGITDPGFGTVQRLAPGQPVGVFYGRVFAGFTDDGQWLYKNAEGESVTAGEIGDNDFQYLGNSIPKYNLGFTSNFRYGNFDASFLLRSALGFKALNAKRLFHENLNNYATMNMFTSAINNGVIGEQYFSSYYLEKGDYMKLDNLTLGYTIPVKGNGYLKSFRIYATGTNLLTITSFSGTDPELNINRVVDPGQEFTAGPGVEPNYSYYPTTRTFTLGVTATF